MDSQLPWVEIYTLTHVPASETEFDWGWVCVFFEGGTPYRAHGFFALR